MKLIIEEILADDTSSTVSLKIRKGLTSIEMLSNLQAFFRSNKHRVGYKQGRVAYLTVDLNYISMHDVTIGDDINNYNDINYSMMTMESTNQEVFDEEALAYNVKMNPTTNEPILHDGKPIYHATFLIPTESYEGDMMLTELYNKLDEKSKTKVAKRSNR